MAHLQFLDGIETSPLKNFWRLEAHGVPATPGVYILLADPGVRFHYPKGTSSIYYIGHSASLKGRLQTHITYARQAKAERRIPLYWGRYEYAAAFGARYCTIKTWRNFDSRRLEDVVLARFAKRYRAFPVANGAGAWSRLAHELGNV